MRALKILWKVVLLVGVIASVAGAYFVSRLVIGPMSGATSSVESGPAAVDGLLERLAKSVDRVATSTGAGSGNPLRQSADQLRSIQKGIGGAENGFDKLGGALDGALGGHSKASVARGTTGPTRLEGQDVQPSLPQVAGAEQSEPELGELSKQLGLGNINTADLEQQLKKLGVSGLPNLGSPNLDSPNLSLPDVKVPAARSPGASNRAPNYNEQPVTHSEVKVVPHAADNTHPQKPSQAKGPTRIE